MRKLIFTILLSGFVSFLLQASRIVDPTSDLNELISSNGTCINCMIPGLQVSDLPAGFKIVNLSGSHLEGSVLDGMDLSNAVLTGAYLGLGEGNANSSLKGCNLTGAQMGGVDFTGADLTGATVSGSNTSFAGASFYGTNLTNANFTGADFTGAGFAGAIFYNTNFTNAKLLQLIGEETQSSKNFTNSKGQPVAIDVGSFLDMRGSVLINVKFNNAQMTNINLSGCVFSNVDFTNATMNGNTDLTSTTNLSGVNTQAAVSAAQTAGTFPAGSPLSFNLNGANLQYANLSNVDLTQNVQFYGTDFSYANLTAANLSGISLAGVGAKFVGTNFTQAKVRCNLSGLDLTGANFTQADLIGAEFSKTASLNNVIFTGANLTESFMTVGSIDSCTFDNANMLDAMFFVGSFTNSSFQNVNLDDSQGFIVTSSKVNATGTNIVNFGAQLLDPSPFLQGSLNLGSITGLPSIPTPGQPIPLTSLLYPSGNYNVVTQVQAGDCSGSQEGGCYMTNKNTPLGFNFFALWTSGNLNSFPCNYLNDTLSVSSGLPASLVSFLQNCSTFLALINHFGLIISDDSIKNPITCGGSGGGASCQGALNQLSAILTIAADLEDLLIQADKLLAGNISSLPQSTQAQVNQAAQQVAALQGQFKSAMHTFNSSGAKVSGLSLPSSISAIVNS